MIAIYKRELGSYFKGMLGYLFSAFLLLFVGIYTMAYNLTSGYPNFEYAVSSVSFIYLIAVPILSMRVIAEEKRQKTDQLLYSLPLPLSSVVIGKYLAMVTVLAVPAAIMCLYPLILGQFGSIHYPTAYSSILGFFLLGSALLAIGLFISSITENQVTAAVSSLAVLLLIYFVTDLASFLSASGSASMIVLCTAALLFGLLLYLFTHNYFTAVFVSGAIIAGLGVWYTARPSDFYNLVPSLLKQLGLFNRFDRFVEGICDLTAIVYDLSVIGVFLFFSVQVLEKRRWSE